MNPVTVINPHIDAVPAPSQMQHLSVASHDVRRFQQALFNHTQTDAMSGNFIKDGIAAIEREETKLSAVMSRLSDPSPAAMSSATLLELQSKHLQMYISYQATARVIGMTAQNITELMRMQ
ncbi:MAG: hypothetical protein JWP38_1116 [Herbaspirillum sp.]|nr:hypothetical protein [Herbaspirillum sp.]